MQTQQNKTKQKKYPRATKRPAKAFPPQNWQNLALAKESPQHHSQFPAHNPVITPG
ncbi:hypothetical protein ACTOWA_05300 [Herbaspirillum seropedicae]|uniref:hypothetical protein n=1 Tax=Herbaspirillum seropedicae TaxID=964 RepID=UPI003F8D2887